MNDKDQLGKRTIHRAAAAVILDHEGRLLLVQQDYGHRKWGLPGAPHVEPHELPTQVIVRELLREIGLETRVTDLVGLYHLSGGDDELPDLLTYTFRCEIVDGEAVINERGRICHVGWHPPDAVPPPATATAKAAAEDAAAGRTGVIRHITR